MESYIKYTQDTEILREELSGCTLEQVLVKASKMYAFSDCTNIEVMEVIHDGMQYFYDGWEPGMVFTFRNSNREIVWQRCFSYWDH